MRETLRTRMGWLHGWVGLVSGLCLLCVFATGTLAVFDTEITRWMQPETEGHFSTHPTDMALSDATTLLRRQQARGIAAFLVLPSVRSPMLEVLHYNGHEFVGDVLDPATGAVIPTRRTAGGKFFYNFHYTLRGGHETGIRVVNMLAMGLLVVVGAGIIIHLHALVPDVVLLRLSTSRIRLWLDVHLLAGVLALPFMVMIAYTGILVHADTIMPAHSLLHETKKGRISSPSALPKPPLQAVPPLSPLLSIAQQNLGGRPCGFILFGPDRMSIFASDAAAPYLTRDHVDFSLPDGHLLGVTLNTGQIATTMQLMHGLHYARFAGPGLRWLYFISGLFGTAVIASGLVLFFMKRRRKSGHLAIFRVAEGLTVASMTSLLTAILAFLWSNRLLPSTLPDRDGMEIDIFFAVWGLGALHALSRSFFGSPLSGWQEQLAAAAIMGCGLPLLDMVSAPQALIHDAAIHMGVDGMGLVAGLVALHAVRCLQARTA
ncbi:PepSY-associated TM helix domain-containing protein [Komagataeibacter sp. SM21]|uniref:PepSY-associated TM helix domain-containing protein n=1 Tax=Komagataeibacter sp. SM21 TaxID=3242899 RepID=UPI0035289BF6